jgi:hypothetical protein
LGGCLDLLALPDAPTLARELICLGAEQGTRAVFLDTETTGMGGSAMAFVVGLAWIDGASVRAAQWTLTRVGGEAELLADMLGTLRTLDPRPLVTFNGRSFDVPLLRLRANRHGLCARVLEGDHVDLLHGARRLQRGRGANCRLQTLERLLLGIERRGDIDSAEIPEVFWTWLRAPQDLSAQRRLQAVCDHNLVDIVSLPALASCLAEMVREPGDLDRARRSARHLQAIGAEEQARLVLARWVEPGLADLRARGSGWREAALELANLERRAGRIEQAAACWREAHRSDPGCPVAAEAWAKHLEHGERAFEAALQVARASRLPCERRIARLERRIERARTDPSTSAPEAPPPAAPLPAQPPGPPHATGKPLRSAAPRSAAELLSVVEDGSGARMRYRLLR